MWAVICDQGFAGRLLLTVHVLLFVLAALYILSFSSSREVQGLEMYAVVSIVNYEGVTLKFVYSPVQLSVSKFYYTLV